MSAFSLLHPTIQEAIYQMAWAELRPLQVRAIQEVYAGEAPLILSAATASGKTEAAFLPLLSKMAECPQPSVQAIYVSPLKALINDQFQRLIDLCEKADIAVHRWHGDVSATAKQHLREQPSGVLLITPESLESLFCHHDRHLVRMFRHLQFVVIDELHAFLDDVRGIHLRSLLSRLEQQTGAKPRRLGLSATLGDFTGAKGFLYPVDFDSVKILQDEGGERELKVSVKSLYDAPGDSEDDGIASKADAVGGLSAVADDIARRFREGANLIFCNRRQDAEVLADKLHHLVKREHWPRDPFVLHHGSLSKDLREDAENRLKKGEHLTALCTSTLEMGIDLGAVKSVGQVDPPWRVASLVQRLGRSGRKEGQAQILRMYALDVEPHAKSALTERLHPHLIRAIAMVELHLEKWLEPPAPTRRHYSTLVHQILSLLRQTGGAPALLIHQRLCEHGAFPLVGARSFAVLLRGLAAKEVIEQTPNGLIILAPAGERIVESRDFYAVFATSTEYTVEHDGSEIGVLSYESVPPPQEHFLLAGRRWRVESIEHESRRVVVASARGWKRPYFSGKGGNIHPRVIKKMGETLASQSIPAYLDSRAQQNLALAREAFAASGLKNESILQSGSDTLWFTWQGSAICETLLIAAKSQGIQVTWDGLAITYAKTSRVGLLAHIAGLHEGLLQKINEVLVDHPLYRDRFDELVPAELLREAYLDEVLNVGGVLGLIAETFGDREGG